MSPLYLIFFLFSDPHFPWSYTFSQREKILFCNNAETPTCVCFSSHTLLRLGKDPVWRYAGHTHLYIQTHSPGNLPVSDRLLCVCFPFLPGLEVPVIVYVLSLVTSHSVCEPAEVWYLLFEPSPHWTCSDTTDSLVSVFSLGTMYNESLFKYDPAIDKRPFPESPWYYSVYKSRSHLIIHCLTPCLAYSGYSLNLCWGMGVGGYMSVWVDLLRKAHL